MNVNCNDRERILEGNHPQEMEALRQHAEGCAACRAELDLWDGITTAAPLLQKSWESPELWPQIRQALAEESMRAPERGRFTNLWAWLPQARTGVAALVLVVLSVAATYLIVKNLRGPELPDAANGRLLNDQALREAERAEAAYMQSLENLSQLAQPRLEQAATPLMQNYREKLLVLDSAIAELRAQADQNRYNAHLRSEMMSLYQEKQRTLEDLLREER